MVLALLNTLPQTPPSTYSVTLNNLFIFIKLLMYLSAKGFGARGTARTNTGVHQELIDHKKSNKNNTILWGTKHLRYVVDKVVTQLN